jgi:predicted amidohydrolase
MRVALCQFDQVWEDRVANRGKIAALVDACAAPFDWLVFPEMTLSAFTMDVTKATLTTEDHTFFAELAARHHAWISFGGVEEGFNKLFTLDREGRLANAYAKRHLYSFAGEDKAYRAGGAQPSFELEGLRVMPAICFDLRFPHEFWDAAPRTDVYVVVASWPAKRADHWMTLLKARAVENQAYVIGVDRTGKDPTLEYSGNSLIVDPLGRVVLDAGEVEGVHVAAVALDKQKVDTTRQRFPFFADRVAGGGLA